MSLLLEKMAATKDWRYKHTQKNSKKDTVDMIHHFLPLSIKKIQEKINYPIQVYKLY